jgi:hypothetical protein
MTGNMPGRMRTRRGVLRAGAAAALAGAASLGTVRETSARQGARWSMAGPAGRPPW